MEKASSLGFPLLISDLDFSQVLFLLGLPAAKILYTPNFFISVPDILFCLLTIFYAFQNSFSCHISLSVVFLKRSSFNQFIFLWENIFSNLKFFIVHPHS